MIIPGLDRIDGTAVTGELLDSDELWHEHTAELMELLEEENDGKSPEDCTSMVQFCAQFASGARRTAAMRRASSRKEWKIDPYAVKLAAFEKRRRTEPAAILTNDEANQHNKSARKGKSRRHQDSTSIALLTDSTDVFHHTIPGIFVCVGAGYLNDDDNSQVRTAFKKVRSLLSPDEFYCIGEHSFHVTLGAFQKFTEFESEAVMQQANSVDVLEIEDILRRSKLLQSELMKGPIRSKLIDWKSWVERPLLCISKTLKIEFKVFATHCVPHLKTPTLSSTLGISSIPRLLEQLDIPPAPKPI
jgi:hypothetical protein